MFRDIIIYSLLSFVLPLGSFGQEKPLYYLADTISKQQQVGLKIGNEGKVLSYYHFDAQLLPSSKSDLIFSYRNDLGKPVFYRNKPNYKYLSWPELVLAVQKYGKAFTSHYDLYIIERLPNKTFMKNKVRMIFNNEVVNSKSAKRN